MPRLNVREERWPLAARFVIARGAKTEAHVVVCELDHEGAVGRGECVPYPRYQETVPAVMAQIESVRGEIEAGAGRERLQHLLPAGAARNALDCAMWDLEAKRSGVPAWQAAGLPRLSPLKTAYTISLGTPEEMGEAARAASSRPMLKLKIGAADDLDRVEAVRAAAPRSRLIVDANEGLTIDELRHLAPELHRLQVHLIEQPLRAGEDEALEDYRSPVPLCADESLHTRAELDVCARRYTAVNVKLDKTGGLTEALALAREAIALDFGIMVGCMVGSSLAMAPAMLLTPSARFVDLDGPLLLARDRVPGLVYEGSTILPPTPDLWG